MIETSNPIDVTLPQPQDPMTWEAYQAVLKEHDQALSERHQIINRGYEAIPSYLNEKVYWHIPEKYRSRLPVYLLARCPLCGGRVWEAVDTFSLDGIGWWYDEPTGFGWLGRKCGLSSFVYGPRTHLGDPDMISVPSYSQECDCVVGVTYGVNFNGILPDDVERGRFIGSEKAGVLKRFMAQEGSYAVIHALGLSAEAKEDTKRNLRRYYVKLCYSW